MKVTLEYDLEYGLFVYRNHETGEVRECATLRPLLTAMLREEKAGVYVPASE